MFLSLIMGKARRGAHRVVSCTKASQTDGFDRSVSAGAHGLEVRYKLSRRGSFSDRACRRISVGLELASSPPQNRMSHG